MITDFSARLTYFGTLDDVVHRYPWPAPLTQETLQQQLITAAIYDKRILINDGYLVANPLLQGELTNLTRSLLGNLLRSGNARMFARGGVANLAAGIERSAPEIVTHQHLLNDRERWQRVRDELEFLSKDVARFTISWPSDKNMGQLFCLLMTRMKERVEGLKERGEPLAREWQDFLAVFERFETSLGRPACDGARTLWEEQCWIFQTGQPVSPQDLMRLKPGERERAFPGYGQVQPLMNIANEMYHLAYSLGALRSIAQATPDDVDPSTVGVATWLRSVHPHLIEPEDGSEDGAPGARRDLAAMNQLLLTIPPGLRFKQDFSPVGEISFNTPTRQAKLEYLAALRAFAAGTATFDATRTAQERYARELAHVLAPMVEERGLEFFVTALMAPVGFALDKVLGPLATIAGVAIGADRLQNKIVERLLRMRVSTALREEGLRAAAGPDSISLAAHYGLYFGPLQPKGANNILDEIQPHPGLKKLS